MNHLTHCRCLPALVVGAWALGTGPAWAETPRNPELSAPTVRRVEVPADRVGVLFPPGTPVRVMPLAELDTLCDQLRDATRPAVAPRAPRILRAVHRATLEGSRLEGSTELLLEKTDTAQVLSLNPWTAAIVRPGPGDTAVRTTPEGTPFLVVGPGPQQQVRFAWSLAGRRLGQRLGFDLGLPPIPVASLALEIPDSLQPALDDRGLDGPSRSDRAGFRIWSTDGAQGALRISVGPGDAPTRIEGGLVPTVHGTTRIVLRSGERTWEAVWSIDAPNRSALELRMGVDPRLAIQDVTGPDISEYRVERQVGGGSQLIVRLTPGADPSEIRVRATHQSPLAGSWAIPALTPLNAVWTGGRYSVELDPLVQVQSIEELDALRVPLNARELPDRKADATTRLAFESTGSGPPASLVLRQRSADACCHLAGMIRLGPDQTRFEARLTWSAPPDPGDALRLSIEPGWSIDHFQILALDEPTTWSVRGTRADGSQEIGALVPSSAPPQTSLTAIVRGRSTILRRAGFRAPRLRTGHAPLREETWCMAVDPRLIARPTQIQGASWIDPDLAYPELPSFLQGNPELSTRIAWRTTSAEDAVSFDVGGRRDPVWATAWVIATCDSGATRTEWFLRFSGVRGRESLELGSTLPLGDSLPGRLSTASRERAVTLVQAPRSAEGPDEHATPHRWTLKIPEEFRGSSELLLRIAVPSSRSPDGVVPLPLFELGVRADRFVLQYAEPGRNLRSTSAGLERADARSLAGELVRLFSEGRGRPLDVSDGATPRAAFRISDPDAHLETIAVPLATANKPGLIEEAELTERPGRDGRVEAELALNVRADGSAPLEIGLGDTAEVIDFEIGDEPSTPRWTDGRLLVRLEPKSRSLDGLSQVRLRYLKPARAVGTRDWTTAWPAFSYPCLTMRWCLDASPDLPYARSRPGQAVPGTAAELRLGSGPTGSDRESGSRLEEVFRESFDPACTLGEALLRIDRADSPVVIDTRAVRALGLRFSSRSASVGSTDRAPSLTDWLRLWRLVAVPGPRGTLITDGPTAARLGSDASALRDGLETVFRQQYEPRLRWVAATAWPSLGSGPPNSELNEPGPFATPRVTIVQSGVDSENPRVERESAFGRVALPIALGLFVFALGLAGSRSRLTARVTWLALLLLLALAASVALGERMAPLCQGLALGSSLCSVLLLARRRGNPAAIDSVAAPGARTGSSLVRAATPMLALVLAVFTLGRWTVAAPAGPADVIVALLPYDPGAGRLGGPTQAVVRLDDLERIQKFIKAPRYRAPAAPGFFVAWASHEVEEHAPGELLLTSRFEVDQSDPAPSTWTIPIGEALTIEAELDGQPLPVQIDSARREARLTLTSRTVHNLRLRLVFAFPAHRSSVLLPFPRVAASEFRLVSARLRSDLTHPDMGCPTSDATLPLGPVDSLAVRRTVPAADDAGSEPTGSSRVLWDIEPAGDRLEIRLDSAAEPPGEPRAIEIDGQWSLIGAGSSSEDRSEPFIGVEPTGEGGTRLVFSPTRPVPRQISLWRAASRQSNGENVRTPPRIRYIGWSVSRSLAAVRVVPPLRVADEPLALAPARALAPAEVLVAAPDVFLSQWGRLEHPERQIVAVTSGDPSGFGPVRWRTPLSADRRATVTTSLRVQPDRVALRFDVVLRASGGPLDRVALELPSSLRVEKIEGTALSEVITSGPTGLVLCFDPLSRESSQVRIEGWVPLDLDPKASATEPRRLEVPSLAFSDVAETEGVLLVEAAPEFSLELERTAGLVPDFQPQSGSAPGLRGRFRVEPGASPRRLLWSLLGRPSEVSVANHLSLFPELAVWDADVRYAIEHGPLHQLILELPSAWSDRADFDVAGTKTVVRKFTQGPRTRVEIQLLDACWGEARLRLRALLAPPEGPLTFPDITPLGLGKADTTIAWSDLTGRSLVAEGTSGVQPVEASRFTARAPALGVQAHPHTYHVLRNGWSLRVREPTADDSATASSKAMVMNVGASVAAGGAVVGSTLVEFRDDLPEGLRFRVPDGCDVVGATLNGVWTTIYRPTNGRVVVPVAGGPNQAIRLYWTILTQEERPATSVLVVPPLPEQGGLPFSMRLFAPVRARASASQGTIRAASGFESVESELEARLRVIQQTAATLDRSDEEAGDALLSQLIAFSLRLREAERQLVVEGSRGPNRPVDSQSESTHETIAAWDQRLAESLVSYGLDSFLTQAKVEVGQEQGSLAPRRGSSTRRVAAPPPAPLLVAEGGPLSFVGVTSNERPTGVRLDLERAVRWPRWFPPSASTLLRFPLAIAILATTVLSSARARAPARIAGLVTLLAAWWIGGYGWLGVPLLLAVFVACCFARPAPRAVVRA
jgi:hypothetical protein